MSKILVHNFDLFLKESSTHQDHFDNQNRITQFFSEGENGDYIFSGLTYDQISDLVEGFVSYLSPLLSNKELSDIHITGSTVNHEKSKRPEIDIILVYDFKNLDSSERKKLKRSIEKARAHWNFKNKPKFSNLVLDLDVQFNDDFHSDSGLYSLKRNIWITKPCSPDPMVDHRDVYQKSSRISFEIDRILFLLEQGLFSQSPKDELIDYLKHIGKRLSDMKSDKPEDPNVPHIGHLCYQKLKKEGYIKKLVGTLIDYS